MTADFQTKLLDFSKSIITAHQQYHQQLYNESLMNMRKAGESFCKVLIHYRHQAHHAEKLISGKSYNELINILKINQWTTPAILNSLQTLQIHGNMAVHDSNVVSEHASMGFNATKLLVRWLYDSFLKMPLPENLNVLFSDNVISKETAKHSESAEAKLNQLINEKAELQKQLEFYQRNLEKDNEQFEQLKAEIKKSADKIESLKPLVVSDDKEVAKKEETPEVLSEPRDIVAASKKAIPLKWKLVASFTVILAVSALLYFYLMNSNSENKISSVSTAATIDSVNAVIVPFSILQDNPNFNLKLEELLLNNLRQAIVQFNIPVRINIDTTLRMTGANFTDMESYAVKNTNQIIISADVFERNSNDSNSVAMKVLMSKKGKNVTRIDLGSFAFIRPTDSNAFVMTKHCMNILQVAAADHYMTTKPLRISNATAILYQTYPLNSIEAAMVAKLLGQCLVIQKKYAEAETEMKKYLALYPKDEGGWQSLANIYEVTKQSDKAESCYKKAISLMPCNVKALLSYAVFLTYSKNNRLEECREKVFIALGCDSTNTNAWLLLGELAEVYRKPGEAMHYYQTCLRFDPDYLPAHKKIAGLMIINQDAKGAIPHLEKILSLDSLNLYALNMLANIYSTAALNNPAKAEMYLQRAQMNGGDTTRITKLNVAMDAFFRQDFDKAIPLLKEYHKIDSTNIVPVLRLYEYYLKIQDYQQAQQMLNKQLQLDEFNPDVNYNNGYFYATRPAPYGDNKKAIFYFQRAVMVNPYDTVSLQNLMMLYGRERATADMKSICERLLQINPQSYDGLKGLCIVYVIEDNLESGNVAFQNALKVYPNDEYLNGEYAIFLMNGNDAHSPVVAAHALVYAKRLMKINPSRPDNHFVLSKALLTNGYVNEARKEYEESIKMNPEKRKPQYEQILYGQN